MNWTQEEAIQLCREIHPLTHKFGCYVGLSGGCLYKDGPRKDCDLLFYRIRQAPEIDVDGLFAALGGIGLERISGFGFCYKCEYQGKKVDCLFPEEPGDYLPEEATVSAIELLDLIEEQR